MNNNENDSKTLSRSETIEAITKFLFIGKGDSALGKYDLVIVLGNHLVELTIDGLFKLYARGTILPNAMIIITGKLGRLNQGQELTEAEQMFNYAVRLGIPGNILFTEPEATNIYQNFALSKKLISQNGGLMKFTSILCIGQAFCLRRAKMSAASCGYPAERMDFYGIVDSDGRNIAPDSWWTTEVARTRVFEELGRISAYALKGDLSL